MSTGQEQVAPPTAIRPATASATVLTTATAATTAAAAIATSKPKRVRTGCLTCRERHLKCDEALPTCVNCRKSGRECKRGVRLNFIDTQCRTPPTVPPPDDWHITFQDNSREIASEYRNGLARYAALNPDIMQIDEEPGPYDFPNVVEEMPDAPAIPQHQLSAMQPVAVDATHANASNALYGDTNQQQPQHQDQQTHHMDHQDPEHFRQSDLIVQQYPQQDGHEPREVSSESTLLCP